jgi:putative membrane protein
MQQVVVTAALILGALAYLRRWYRLRRNLPAWRLAAFMGGLLLLWAVMGSPLAALDHELLTFHMLQHLALMTVAAPLILLGLGRVPWRAHPVFCWLASTATVIGWHVPALFALGMRSEGWHLAEHACFFVAGLLFWWPVIQPWSSLATGPRWSVPLYLFLATLPCDALSAFLTFCGRVVYPHYLHGQRLFDISPLGDQEIAGALMWIWVTFAYLAPAAAVTIRMLSPQSLRSPVEVV